MQFNKTWIEPEGRRGVRLSMVTSWRELYLIPSQIIRPVTNLRLPILVSIEHLGQDQPLVCPYYNSSGHRENQEREIELQIFIREFPYKNLRLYARIKTTCLQKGWWRKLVSGYYLRIDRAEHIETRIGQHRLRTIRLYCIFIWGWLFRLLSKRLI